MNTVSLKKFDLVVGIDRSDKSFQACLLEPTQSFVLQEVSTNPTKMIEWWNSVLKAYPRKRIAVAFEQPARNLIAFFAGVRVDAIFALNPSLTWAFRHSTKVSGARTDASDAVDIATYVLIHQHDLTPWQTPDPIARQIRAFTLSRRKLVDQRSAFTNRLQETLKSFYPQALDFFHQDIFRAINLDFVRRWPTPESLQQATEEDLIEFFRSHGSRSAKRMEERLENHRSFEALTSDPAIIQPAAMETLALVDLIETLNKTILQYDKRIESLFRSAGDHSQLIEALPGAGPALAPRLFCALALNAAHCESAGDLAAVCGMAPVTRQSGKMRSVRRRIQCDAFTRQTFHEWAKESWKFSKWAKAFVKYHQSQGKHFHTIIRILAVKWIRILFRIWKTGEAYDESKYIASLIKRGHYLAPELKK